jgi:hypothetical protein
MSIIKTKNTRKYICSDFKSKELWFSLYLKVHKHDIVLNSLGASIKTFCDLYQYLKKKR